jgi:hypothetical protein
MEEAVAFFVKYKDWIIPAIFLVLGLPTAIIGNRIDAYLQNRSLSAREQKIKALLIRYEDIKKEVERPPRGLSGMPIPRYFVVFPILSIGLVVLILELIPEFSWLRFFLVLIVSLPMYYATIMIGKAMSNHLAYLKDVVYFDSFKKRTLKELKRLGCNPSDYGIE